ncbi:MAG: lysylphosphatidylglycerol synthase domain-containing protein, partial [Acidimicrobiales bacterium]
GLAFEILTVGFAYQLAVMLGAFLAAKAMGLAVGWTAILAFFPVVAIVQVLPLTVSGLGTREAALVFFLHPLGVAQADAFALGLLIYFVNLGVSLLGAPAFALGSRARAVA